MATKTAPKKEAAPKKTAKAKKAEDTTAPGPETVVAGTPEGPAYLSEVAGQATSIKITQEHATLIEGLLALDEDLSLVQKRNYFTIVKGDRIVFTIERTQDPKKFTLLFNRINREAMAATIAEYTLIKEPEGFYYEQNDLRTALIVAQNHLETLG